MVLLDQLAETIKKTAFLLSENHHVISSYLYHKDELCLCLKSNLERGLRDDLWIKLVLFLDGEKPTKYLFPSTVWKEFD